MSLDSLSSANSIAAAYGNSHIHASPTRNNLSATDLSDIASSRSSGEALSKVIDRIPFMYQAKGTIATALNNAHAPFLLPLRVLNSSSNNNLFRMIPAGTADKAYEVLYYGLLRFLPVGKVLSKLGVGNSLSEKLSNTLISGMKKANIKMDEAPVREFVNELVGSLNKIYDPKFLKENVDKYFFTKALTHGSEPYEELTDVLIQGALDKAGEKMVEALNQGVSAIKSGAVQEGLKEAVGETATKAKDNVIKTANNAKGAALNTAAKAKNAAINTATATAAASKDTISTAKNLATKSLPMATKNEDKETDLNHKKEKNLLQGISASISNLFKIPSQLFAKKPAEAYA